MNMKEWFGDAPQIVIKTPATSAKMGPGFDCVGMAVNLHNELWLKKLTNGESSRISVEGYGAGESETLDNLIYRTYAEAMSKIGREVQPIALQKVIKK